MWGERAVTVCTLLLALVALSGVAFPDQAQSLVLAVFPSSDRPDIDAAGNSALPQDEVAKYVNLLSINDRLRQAAFAALEKEWQPTDTAIVLDVLAMTQRPEHKTKLYALLREKTGQDLPDEPNAWYAWLWQVRPGAHRRLREVKHLLYTDADPSFRDYFARETTALVPLDEIILAEYGTDRAQVLRKPLWIAADQAGYLDDSEVVSGLVLPGETRAYPWKVLQYFHLVEDRAGDLTYIFVWPEENTRPVAFNANWGEIAFRFAPSSLLHRSTMLLGDDATSSLWSAADGRAVYGPQAGKGAQLEILPVEEIQWGSWRAQHPQTKVLANAVKRPHP